MNKVGRPAVMLALLMALAIVLGPQRGEARTDPSKYWVPEENKPHQIGDPDGGGGDRSLPLIEYYRATLALFRLNAEISLRLAMPTIRLTKGDLR